MFGSDGPAGRGQAILALPRRCLLSNGRYQTLITESGSGFSRLDEQGLTAWSPDPLADLSGFFIYLRDLDDGAFWSAGRRPCPAIETAGEVRREPGFHSITRTLRGVESRLETCVLPEAWGEVRRLRLRNLEARRRRIEITTYGEVALQEPAAHAGHPGFSRLFVRSELDPASRVLLFRRRARANGEEHPWMVHALLDGNATGCETDRARFLGRGRSPRAPQALCASTPLSGTCGDVLDPVFCLRTVVEIEPGGDVQRSLVLGAAADRGAALALVGDLGGEGAEEAFRESARREEALLRAVHLSRRDAEAWDRLAGTLLYRDPQGRGAGPETATAGIDRMTALGLTGSRPLLLACATTPVGEPVEEAISRGLRYWEAQGLAFDVVVLNGSEATVFAGPGAPETPPAPRRFPVTEEVTTSLRASARTVIAL